MLKRAAITLPFSLLLLSSFAQTQLQKKEKPLDLFTISKRHVTVDEFVYLYKKNHQDLKKDFTTEKINEYLDLFVNFKLKVQEAKSRGLDTTKVFLDEYNGYKDELRKPYLPDAKIVDSLTKLTYNRMQEEIKASHILVTLKPDASPADTAKAYARIVELRERALNEDFGVLASEASDDPSAKQNKGSLGYFTAMQMVYSFESAAYATKVGEVSQPVRTRFGYHIVKVLDRRPSLGEVEVSHIMIRTGATKDNDQVRNTIFNVHDQLQAGVGWNELCLQYSEDASTKEEGGKLRPFGAGAMAAVPEFERIAFYLEKPGEISDPFQTQYGWHIMKLERKIPVPSFEEIAPSLKSRVARDERTELSKQALQIKLRKDYAFVENQVVKTKTLALADSNLIKGKWRPVSTKADKEVLFTLQGKKYIVKDFFLYVQKNQRASKVAPGKYMDQLYQQYVDGSIMKLVEEKIIAQHPDYQFLLNEYYEGILLFDIMEKEVWSKASQDSIGQQTYYTAHTSDYAAGERARASLYSSNDIQHLETLNLLIRDSVTAKIDELVSQRKIKAESGYFKKDDRAVLQKVPWTKGVHSVENNGMYYLAWLKDILQPGPMSFEEARPAVISDYQTYLEKIWVSQLKKKYPVKMNEKGKQYILQQLQIKE